MLSIFGTLFSRNFITKCSSTSTNWYKSYHQCAQFMQNVGKNANVLCIMASQFKYLPKVNPMCFEIVVKPFPPLREPVDKTISQVLDMTLPPLCVPLHIGKLDPLPKMEIDEPSNNTSDKQAARLIVIRRRKMKKHKLRKLRKKMKFVWAKVRHRRELKKEKLFQSILVSQINEAEKFDAAKYVAEKLRKAQEFSQPKEETQHKTQRTISSNKNQLS